MYLYTYIIVPTYTDIIYSEYYYYRYILIKHPNICYKIINHINFRICIRKKQYSLFRSKLCKILICTYSMYIIL